MLMCSKVKYKVKFGCGIAVQRSDTSLNTDGISSADEQARPGGYSAQRKYNCWGLSVHVTETKGYKRYCQYDIAISTPFTLYISW